jgi:tRNA threonylcarbamoyladenosine biosynthesis protein TsaE
MTLIDRKVTSLDGMSELGREIAGYLRDALERERTVTVCLDGDMGVGKTTLVAGICADFGVLRAKSPTYTVVNEYRGELPIFHFDFYRLADEDDLASIGYADYLSRRALLFIEWSRLLADAIPRDAFRIFLEKTDEETGRRVRFLKGDAT